MRLPHALLPAVSTQTCLVPWGSDDALKMANLQESEKLFLFNLQTEQASRKTGRKGWA